MSAREWDASSYDRISGPMEELGRGVIDRLPLAGDELVLDAGCGSGRVTEILVARVPRGRVIAVDASAAMVEVASERLGDRADVRQVDLLELELGTPVDAVLSTATFHWIADHDRLYARLHAAMSPDARLAAQCGGEGNVRNVHAAAAAVAAQPVYAPYFADWRGPWNFTAPAQAEAALARAGFRDIRCWLTPVGVVPDAPLEYLRTIVLGAHAQRLPDELRNHFVEEVAEQLGDPLTIDYVRLNIDAQA